MYNVFAEIGPGRPLQWLPAEGVPEPRSVRRFSEAAIEVGHLSLFTAMSRFGRSARLSPLLHGAHERVVCFLDNSVWIRTVKCCAISTRALSLARHWVGDSRGSIRSLMDGAYVGAPEVGSIWEAGTSTRAEARHSGGHQSSRSHALWPAETTQTERRREPYWSFWQGRVRAA